MTISKYMKLEMYVPSFRATPLAHWLLLCDSFSHFVQPKYSVYAWHLPNKRLQLDACFCTLCLTNLHIFCWILQQPWLIIRFDYLAGLN